MTTSTNLKIAGFTLAATVLAAGVQAAPLTNLGTDRGGIVVNLHGGAIDAPIAKSDAAKTSSVYVNVGTDRGGVVRNVTGAPVKAPVAGTRAKPSNQGYVNIGTDRGGVLIPR